MAFAEECDWQIAHPWCVRALLSLAYGLISFHVWSYRHAICAMCHSGMCSIKAQLAWLQRGSRDGPDPNAHSLRALEARLDELRINQVQKTAAVFMHISLAWMTWIVIIGAAMVHNLGHGFVGGFTFTSMTYLICCGITHRRIPVTIRSMDMMFAVMMTTIMFRVSTSTHVDFFLTGAHRGLSRIVLAILYLQPRRMLAWNVLLSVVTCWKFSHSKNLLHGVDTFTGPYLMVRFAFLEIIFVCVMTTLCVCVRQLQFSWLSAQLETEDSHRAIYKILSVLCDAVVRLGPAGEILSPSSQLRHVLRVRPDEPLEGCCLADSFATNVDRSRFEDFLRAPVSREAASALHVHVASRSEPPRNVVLLRADLPDVQGKPGHLIGLREAGNSEPRVDAPSGPFAALMKVDVPKGQLQLPTEVRIQQGQRRGQKKSRGGGASISSTSSANVPLVVPVRWPEVSLSINAMSREMRSCTIHYVDPDKEEDTAALPTLKECTHNDDVESEFAAFLQNCVNALVADPDAELPPYGPISLIIPCVAGDGGHAVCLHSREVRIEAPPEVQDVDEEDPDVWVVARLFELSQNVEFSETRSSNSRKGLPAITAVPEWSQRR